MTAHLAGHYDDEHPERAYAFLKPYVDSCYGRIGVRVAIGDDGARHVSYLLLRLVYYPYLEENRGKPESQQIDQNCWEVVRDCTDEEVEHIAVIRSLYELEEELPAKGFGVSSFKHLKLGSRKREAVQVLLAA